MEQRIISTSNKRLALPWLGLIFSVLSFFSLAPVWEGWLRDLCDFSLGHSIVNLLGIQGTIIYSFLDEIDPTLIFSLSVTAIVFSSISLKKNIGRKALSLTSLIISLLVLGTLIALIIDFILFFRMR
jgi:hypothetical protein